MAHMHERIHLARIDQFVARLSRQILTHTVPFRAEFARSREPVPFEARGRLDYGPAREGLVWGETWDSAWFHLQAEVPREWAGRALAARIDLGGECLVVDADGAPLVGLTSGSVFDGHYNKDLLHLKNRTIAEARQALRRGQPPEEHIPWEKTSILFTGGTGSFGRHFCKVMLETKPPQVIRVYSRGERKQNEMYREFGDDRVRYIIGDVRELDRLKRAMEGIDIVIHGAALKQMASCEFNPLEAVKTNIHGAQNIIDAAIDAGVKKVIALSSDEAVHPANLYGATKLCAEKIFIHGNAYAGSRGTRFSCIRYGETVEEIERLMERFRKERKTGCVTVPDERMTRFWIRFDESVDCLLRALALMRGGEIFVPRVPSIRVIDLARAVAPGCEIRGTGLRPGEKLHDILITDEEGRMSVLLDQMYVIKPCTVGPADAGWDSAVRMPDGFVYSSQDNARWLSEQELQSQFDRSLSA